MKHRVLYTAFAVLVWVGGVTPDGRAQENTPPHVGVPQDWTQHHVIFTRDGLLRHPEALYREPRVYYKALQRSQRNDSALLPAATAALVASTATSSSQDWNVSLGSGRIAPNMYPAKYRFDPTVPADCTLDFLVMGLTATGAIGGQANLVAFNNLYAGTGGLCGAAPTVMFAYDATTVAGGRISTSPVLSQDGKKIAFVESNPNTTQAIFHVLTWTAGQGTITAAAAPTSMTSTVYSPTANSTTSSPWVDYASDTAYVGADNGTIHKITGVFRGTPTEVLTAPWPISIGTRPSPPVLDSVNGYLMVGGVNGRLYRINITTGAVTNLIVGAAGQRNPGILAPPIVDVTNGVTFVVSSNDGTSGVLVEANTLTMTQITKGRIGVASRSGTTIPLYQPALDDNYYNNPVTGVIRSCGTAAAAINPWQYSFGFTLNVNNIPVMNSAASFSQQLLASTAARCTGWTEFFNPNIGGGTDFFFFGLTSNCVGASGCVAKTTGNVAPVTAAIGGGPTGIVVDNFDTTSGQASSIYFCARNVNRAYKLTQSGLN